MTRLSGELRTARACGAGYVKIVHGYGSSGRGGAIKAALPARLAELKKAGRIRAYVAGEDFSPFDADARAMLDEFPELRRDADFAQGTHGVTVVLL